MSTVKKKTAKSSGTKKKAASTTKKAVTKGKAASRGTPRRYEADAVVVGAGLAGLAATLELIERGRSVILVDRDSRENLGGLARQSFGGVCMVGTPYQRRMGVKDSPDLAREDWLRYGELAPDARWPRAWIDLYVNESDRWIYSWLNGLGVSFLPVVNWPERGLHVRGNSVPRWHIAWGTGYGIIEAIERALFGHKNIGRVTFCFRHRVDTLVPGDRPGCSGIHEETGETFTATGDSVIVTAGGIGGGDMSYLRRKWRQAPARLLNGAHIYADGTMHEAASRIGARLSNLDQHWHYAAGIEVRNHPIPHHGVSLVPPRSALWVNAYGKRIMPPLIAYTDTSFFVQSILRQPGAFSWQVLNRKIAWKELAVSGSEHMTAYRNKSRLGVLAGIAFGQRELLRRLEQESDDVILADSIDELVQRMNRLETEYQVDRAILADEIRRFDAEVEKEDADLTDEQLLLINEHRKNRGDRLRIAWKQKIDDGAARPFVAFRERILSRKSLGGIETDLQCRVLDRRGRPIPGFYAAGEAAGFGGGGIHGRRSLEGTFLGSCVLTGRVAGSVAGGAAGG